jgi:hypothetical protein
VIRRAFTVVLCLALPGGLVVLAALVGRKLWRRYGQP